MQKVKKKVQFEQDYETNLLLNTQDKLSDTNY